jgi:hypothetical protein
VLPALILIAGHPVGLRYAEPGDVAYVVATWLQSMTEGVTRRRRGRRMEELRPEVQARLARYSAVVACSPEHPSTIHGWICWGARGLEYVFVPYKLRGHGLAKAMVAACERGVESEREAA